MNLPILQASTLRAIETANLATDPSLMERAGAGAARIALEMLAGRALILAGPGNNGGDAFVVARLLGEAGHDPVVLFAGDPEKLPAAARQALAAWLAAGGNYSAEYPAGKFGLIIDGLFGIGLARPIEGIHAAWVERINASGCPVIALDTPSGLNALTGQITGPTVRASHTVTFIALKTGLLTGDGPDYCGAITVCDLGLNINGGDGSVVEPALFRRCLQPRRRNSHKGNHGSVAIIGGAAGMAGAALLAGRAALKLGAGRVYLGMLERLAVDPVQPELMLRTPDDAIRQATVLAIGPGLGQSAQAGELLAQALDSSLPLVIDADGLNLLAQNSVLMRKLVVRSAPTAGAVPPAPTSAGAVPSAPTAVRAAPQAATLLTPHPAEAARLLRRTTAEVQADRLSAALLLATRLHVHVALKGCGTIIAAPDGRWFINATGNPGLATAGSGDVLTGMLAALLAQAWPPLEALLCAVHLHGAAADACVAGHVGPVGLAASEITDPARRILNDWIAKLDR